LDRAAAAAHLDWFENLVKLTVLLATTGSFADHAPVAGAASNRFVQIFGPEAGHVRLSWAVPNLPMGALLMVGASFGGRPLPANTATWEICHEKLD